MSSEKIPSVLIDLYDDQIVEIEGSSIFAKMCEASDAGKPGFLAAQVHTGTLRVFFIDHERALKFQKLMGQEVGRTTGEFVVERVMSDPKMTISLPFSPEEVRRGTTPRALRFDAAWKAICGDAELRRARDRLSIDELRKLVNRVLDVA